MALDAPFRDNKLPASSAPILPVIGICAAVLYFLYVGSAIYVDRALYADGAQFFIQPLSDHFLWPVFDDSKHIRLFVNILNQLPASIGIKLGLQEPAMLRTLFGLGLFCSQILLYVFCYLLAKRANDFRLLLLALINYISAVLPSEIFIINQAITSTALVWLLAHYAILDLRLRVYDWVAIALISVALFRAHEGMLMLGPLLTLLAGLKLYQTRKPFTAAVLPALWIAVLGILHAGFTLYWQKTHPVEQQTQAFLQLVRLFSPLELWQGNTRISLAVAICALAILAAAWWQVRTGKTYRRSSAAPAFAAAIGIAILYFGLRVYFDHELLLPEREYSYRVLIPFGTAGWLGVAWLVYALKMPFPRQEARALWFVFAVGLASHSIWQLAHNLHWSRFRAATAHVVATSSTPLLAPERVLENLQTKGQAVSYRYGWPWTWPLFGIALQNHTQVQRVFTPLVGHEYFNLRANGDTEISVPFISFYQNGLYHFDGLHRTCRQEKCQ